MKRLQCCGLRKGWFWGLFSLVSNEPSDIFRKLFFLSFGPFAMRNPEKVMTRVWIGNQVLTDLSHSETYDDTPACDTADDGGECAESCYLIVIN